jgi:hypothetical protein
MAVDIILVTLTAHHWASTWGLQRQAGGLNPDRSCPYRNTPTDHQRRRDSNPSASPFATVTAETAKASNLVGFGCAVQRSWSVQGLWTACRRSVGEFR